MADQPHPSSIDDLTCTRSFDHRANLCELMGGHSYARHSELSTTRPANATPEGPNYIPLRPSGPDSIRAFSQSLLGQTFGEPDVQYLLKKVACRARDAHWYPQVVFLHSRHWNFRPIVVPQTLFKELSHDQESLGRSMWFHNMSGGVGVALSNVPPNACNTLYRFTVKMLE
ncbi:hypothetical protein K488DRAFT_70757 [Vararia minispora EC-137]|uniref:Uncharacterized protein n=1 Tax=Vararia minispora EC-137 TaxID=1314806 RepID=A0ACB8QL03_9AGAM|nr:hypothetical protein K488DRAFT_70757 [Vararia minispora EC-137]